MRPGNMASLPEELISDILIRLPVDDLGKFKYVSKSWFSLISSPRFVKAILARTYQNIQEEEEIIVTTTSCKARNSSNVELNHHFSINSDEEMRSLNFHPAVSGIDLRNLSVMSSCNGLLLFLEEDVNTAAQQLYISNPTTGEFVALPPAAKHFGITWTLIHDASVDKHKVCGISTDSKLIVLMQGETNWTELCDIPKTINGSQLVVLTKLLFVNKELHWLTIDGDGEDNKFYCLFSVNIETGEFARTKVSPDVTPKKLFSEPCDHLLTEVEQSVMITIVFHREILMFRLKDRAQCRWSYYYYETMETLFHPHEKKTDPVVESFLSAEVCILTENGPANVRETSKMLIHRQNKLYITDFDTKIWGSIGYLSKDQKLSRRCVAHFNSLVNWA